MLANNSVANVSITLWFCLQRSCKKCLVPCDSAGSNAVVKRSEKIWPRVEPSSTSTEGYELTTRTRAGHKNWNETLKQHPSTYRTSKGVINEPEKESVNYCARKHVADKQWHTQKTFMGGFHAVAYGGDLYLVCAFFDVTIRRHIYVFKRSLLT